MIAKSVSYQHLFRGITAFSSADRKTLFAARAVAKYVLGLELDELEAMLLGEAVNIGAYGPDERGDDGRVLDAAVFNLESDSKHDQAIEFAYRVAASGKNALRQIVVAYGEEPAPDEMAARHREVFRRVLRAENKPIIYSKHGDTRFDHFHLAVCTADRNSGKVGDWGQEKEIEALHIATAICEAHDNLKPEPNRRYVADETGVYHTWSGMRIAEANGDIINRGTFRAVEAEQAEFDTEVLAPGDAYVGQALPTHKAIKLLARGVAGKAKTWDQLHRGLARVGVRYEPYYAKGEIEGGHLIANGVLDKEDDRIAASHANAGFERLCKRLGNRPYEALASDIHVRSFVAPAYRKMQEDSANDLSQDIDRQEHIELQARIKRELQEFEQALQDRRQAIKNERAEAARARQKMETLDEKRRHHNRQQKRERASREEAEEILRELRLTFDREAGRKRKGPRPRTEPAAAVLWGDPPNRFFEPKKRPGKWADRYSIETSDHGRTYHLDGKIVFVEKADFIAMYSDDSQSKIDALRRAHEKFGKVRIVGPASFRREMLLLAAQMEIPLEAKQAKEAEKLLAKSRTKKPQDGEVIYDSTWLPRSTLKKPTLPPWEELLDHREREKRCDQFAPQVLKKFHRRNAREDEEQIAGKPNATKIPVAHRLLCEMDCDKMLLCASRFSTRGIRFLDDVELLKQFGKLPHTLVRPEIQHRLEAIRRVQQAKREWILTGLAQGEFKLQKDKLVIPDSYGAWPSDFVDGQRRDPAFVRHLRKAATEGYSDKTVDLAIRPEISVWREVRAGADQDQGFATFIVDEFIRTTKHADREAIFRTLKYDEAEKLRRTPGLAAKTYLGYVYRQDGESDRAFKRRETTAKRSDRRQGR